jgi:membrane protease YdiL (CAAX protease family)
MYNDLNPNPLIPDKIVNTESIDNKIKWPSIIIFFSIFLGVTLVISTILSLIIAIYIAAGKDLMFILEGYNMLILDGVIFFTVFFSYKRIRQFTLQAFDFSVLRLPKTYGLLAGSLVLFFLSQSIFITLLGIDDGSQQPSDLGIDKVFQAADQNWLKMILVFVSIAVLTPIKEEILYRGILHRFLEQRHHFWIGLLVSSLVFGLLHVGFPYSAITMGIIFVLLYRLTHSLIPPIILHIIWNSFAAVSFMLAS